MTPIQIGKIMELDPRAQQHRVGVGGKKKSLCEHQLYGKGKKVRGIKTQVRRTKTRTVQEVPGKSSSDFQKE